MVTFTKDETIKRTVLWRKTVNSIGYVLFSARQENDREGSPIFSRLYSVVRSIKNEKVNEFTEEDNSLRFESETRQKSNGRRYKLADIIKVRPFVNMRNFDCLPHAGSRRRCAAQLSTYTTSPHRHLHTKCTVACRWRESLGCDRVLYM